MASSATQELLDDGGHVSGHGLDRAPRADQAHALGLGAQDLQIAASHPTVERERLALEAVEAAPIDAPQAGRGRQIEEQRQIGKHAPGRPQIQLANQVVIHAAAVALIGERGVGVPVAEDDAAALEPRPDLLVDVLLAGRHEEEDFRERRGVGARQLEQLPDGLAELGAVRLGRLLDTAALTLEGALQPGDLGGLSRPLDALERDQHSPHATSLQLMQYATLARGLGATNATRAMVESRTVCRCNAPGHPDDRRRDSEEITMKHRIAIAAVLVVLVAAGAVFAEVCLSPYVKRLAGPEKFLYVSAVDADGRDNDFLAVVDVSLPSPTYGRVVNTLSLGSAGNEPHHMGWSDDRTKIWVGTLLSKKLFIVDVAADPSRPTIVKTIEDISAVTGLHGPHTYYALPGRMLLTFLSSADGNPPGGMAEFTNDGELVRVIKNPADSPYAYDVAVKPDVNRMITSSFTPLRNYRKPLPQWDMKGDGKRMYVTNSLLSTMDYSEKFWVRLVHIGPDGRLKIDPFFDVDFTKFPSGAARAHDMLLN